MEERKQRKTSPDYSELKELENFVLKEPESIEIASGYSISIKYDKNGSPIIYVKKYGDIETRGLRRQIERSYPGAAIQGLEKPRLIEVEDGKAKKSRKTYAKRNKRDKKTA